MDTVLCFPWRKIFLKMDMMKNGEIPVAVPRLVISRGVFAVPSPESAQSPYFQTSLWLTAKAAGEQLILYFR